MDLRKTKTRVTNILYSARPVLIESLNLPISHPNTGPDRDINEFWLANPALADS